MKTAVAIIASVILVMLVVFDIQAIPTHSLEHPNSISTPSTVSHLIALAMVLGLAIYIGSFAIPPRNERTKTSNWIPELDGMRALAALSVVTAHSYNRVFSSNYPTNVLSLFLPFVNSFNFAGMGVCFFYALSAFLLTYLNTVRGDELSIPAFYVRRIARIWPLYFTVLIALYAYFGVEEKGTIEWYKDHWYFWVFFIANWSLSRLWGGSFDVQVASFSILWSISVEEQFYAVFPWFLKYMLRSVRIAIGVAVAFVIVAFAIRISFLYRAIGYGMYYATTTYLEIFLAGGFAGYLAAKRRIPSFLKGRWQLCVLVVAILFLGHEWAVVSFAPYGGPTHWTFAVIIYPLFAVCFAGILLWLMANRDSLVCRFLSCPLMNTLGILSFGMYVWHIPANVISRKFEDIGWISLCAPQFTDIRQILGLLVHILVTISFAAVSYVLVERPALNLSRRLTGSRHDVKDRSANIWIALPACLLLAAAVMGLSQLLPK